MGMTVKPVRPSLILFCLVFLAACAAPGPKPVHKVEKDFIFATIRPGDSYRSLAAAYLNDPSRAWLIAQANKGRDLVPGRMAVIPLVPLYRGGLKTDGYQTVPVLVYHGFSRQKADKTHVAKADFENQMKFLKDKGYSVITLDRFLDFLNFKSSIPPKSVVLTFDSGRRTVYDIAYPILKKYGYPGTLFVQTDFIGHEKAMSWDQ
ncbi:MAG: polysaccharide deacetylase family protein, partial [Thermodesulfobacteriota bacterium]|nr:polysaccharide deacetylase family protein [Thermodesulfobacteriota bacterium]